MVQIIRLAFLAGLLLTGASLPAQNVPSCTITAAPTSATGSADVTVTWDTTHAVSCVASGGWAGVRDCAGGSAVMQDVTQNRTFILTVKAATGKSTVRWTQDMK